MLEINKIHRGDCLELMKQIDDNVIDMILCDLPYGTTQNKWDSIIDLGKLWEQYHRIIKENGAIVLTATQPFASKLIMSNLNSFKYEWIWYKNSATGHLNAKRMPMRIHENILVFGTTNYFPQGLQPFGKITRRGHNGSNFGTSGKENYQEFTNYPRSVLEISNDKSRKHPTQKPIVLFEYLIKTYSNEGNLVLDNCIGSGTTAIACKQSNRYFIGIEKNKEYCEIANKRLEQVSLLSTKNRR